MHIEARMNASAGECCSVGDTHIVAWRRQIWRVHAPTGNAGAGSNAAGNLLKAVSEQSEKLHVKSLGMALRAGFRKVTPCRTACANIPASLFPVLFDGGCRRKIRASRRGVNRLADYTEQRQRLKSRLLQPCSIRWFCWWWQRAWSLFCCGSGAENHRTVRSPRTRAARPTRALIAMSDALQASGVYWLRDCWRFWCWGNGYSKILLCAALGQNLAAPARDRACCARTDTARFSRTLSILTASSVPLLKAFRPLPLCRQIAMSSNNCCGGRSRPRRKQSARRAGGVALFPPMMLYMIASGEQSGELEPCLSRPLSTRSGNLIPRWGCVRAV